MRQKVQAIAWHGGEVAAPVTEPGVASRRRLASEVNLSLDLPEEPIARFMAVMERVSQEESPDKKKRCERVTEWPEAWRFEYEAWRAEPEQLKRRQLWSTVGGRTA